MFVAGRNAGAPTWKRRCSGLQALADHDGYSIIESLRPERLGARRRTGATTGQSPRTPDSLPVRVIEPTDGRAAGPGFELMPEPDGGDMMLGFEGHRTSGRPGLFFLFGYIVKGERRLEVRAAVGAWTDREAGPPPAHRSHRRAEQRPGRTCTATTTPERSRCSNWPPSTASARRPSTT